ncbi:MAG: cation:proton antiporter [Conexivisphaerales archaeon]
MLFNIIWQVLIVLALALILGEFFTQLKLPAVAGELAAGLILGPSVLNLVNTTQEIQSLSSIALFFIIFFIGFQMKTETLRRHVTESVLVTLTSFVVPLIVVTGIIFVLFPFTPLEKFIISLAIAVPSISIISVMVMQFDLLQEKTGHLILSSVIVTDIVAFVVLATVSETLAGTLRLLLFLAIFLALFALVDRFLNSRISTLQRFLKRASTVFKREYISFTILIILGLFISFIFQAIGLSFIIGAFFAGLILHEELIGKEAYQSFTSVLSIMNNGFFIPVFFGFAGVEAELTRSDYSLVGYLLIAIAISLTISITLTYYFVKLVIKEPEEADPRNVSVILGGRGAVGIVIVTVALGSGLIGITSYSLVIFGTTITSIVIPLLLKR